MRWLQTLRLPLGDVHCVAFMATVVAKGRGMGVVVRTGLNTEVRRIRRMHGPRRRPPRTHLQ